MTPDQARSHLTQREYDAWILWRRGMSQHNIAIVLGIGRRTVRDRLHEAHAKLFEAQQAEPVTVKDVDITDHVHNHGHIDLQSSKENRWPTAGVRKPTSSHDTKPPSSPTSSETSTTTTHAPSKTPAPTAPPTAATRANSEASPPSDATWLDTFPAQDPTSSDD